MLEPPTKPLSDAERLDWLRLIRSENVGPVVFRQLLERYGSPAEALEALPELARRAGGKRRIRLCSPAEAEAELAAARKASVRLLALGEPDYPAPLRELDDAPPILAVLGEVEALALSQIGIVGARNASANGRRLAGRLAADLVEAGFSVASGMARGIDTAAHAGALPRPTVAVVAGGVDIVYPPENAPLHAQIVAKGAVIAEMPLGTMPQARHFPRRNRLISGLSRGVVVVEAARRSGSLITARFAGDQGREVFAVPGSPLDPRAGGRLLRVIESLKADGVGVIFISHRLGEVKRCADRVVVLRDGRVVATLARDAITPEAMIRHMIGRELRTLYTPPRHPPGAPLLEIVGLRTATRPDRSVSLQVRSGEIVGLAGLIGAGRTDLALALFGITPPIAGEIRIAGEAVAIRSPQAAIAKGLFLVPEDRKRSGLVLDFSIGENVSLASLGSLLTHGLVDPAKETRLAQKWREQLSIRCPDTEVLALSLSGGNQQKVVLAKWLSMAPRVLIFDEPTRGVDVGAKQEIYALMRLLSDSGAAVLMISSDMEEVIGVSDRIAVMHEGAISGHLARDAFSEESILSLAVGRARAGAGPGGDGRMEART